MIVTSAAVGLLMVGILAVALTPGRSGVPSAVESTATPLRAQPVAVGPELATTAALVPPRTPFDQPAPSPMAVVTPVGEDGFGVTTLEAVAGKGDTLTARLPSGPAVRIVVVGTDQRSGLALVALPEAVRNAGGFRMADEQAGPDDTVVVHGVETTVVELVELAHLEFAEGTPVLDEAGDLVGLCSDAERGTKLVPLADEERPTTPTSAPPPTAPVDDTTVVTPPATDEPVITIAIVPDSDPGTQPETDSTDVSSSVAASEPQD